MSTGSGNRTLKDQGKISDYKEEYDTVLSQIIGFIQQKRWYQTQDRDLIMINYD